jgi:hypothetical protein
MATLKEFENADNATGVMPEFRSKLTQMYQYLNRSVNKFLLDSGSRISAREYANDAAALAAGLKVGDLYSLPTGEVRVIK